MAQPGSALAATALAIASAVASATTTDGEPVATYRDDVLPIFERSCLKCHGPDRMRGGVDLSTYDALLASLGGQLVTAGDPEASTLWQVASHESEPTMPPSGDRLPDEEVAALHRWIEGGLVERAGGARREVERPTVSLAIDGPTSGRPEGLPAMPTRLSLEPRFVGTGAIAQTAVACAPWSPLIATRGPRQVTLFHAETGALLGVLPYDEGMPECVRFSRDGRLLVVGGGEAAASGSVALYDVSTGDRLFGLGDEADTVLSCDLSADRALVALGGPTKRLRIYSTETGELRFDVEKHADWITSVRYSPDGVLLATADRAGGLYVWEAFTGREFHTLAAPKGGVHDLAWSANSDLLVSAHDDGTVRLWKMEDGAAVRSIRAGDGGVLAVAVAKDGRIAATGRDRKVKVFDAAGKTLLTLDPATDVPWSVAFSHDDALVVRGDWDGAVTVFDSRSGAAVRSIDANVPTLATRLADAESRASALRPLAEGARRELDALLAETQPVRERHDRLAAARREAERAIEAAAAELAGARATRDERTARIERLRERLAPARADLAGAARDGREAAAALAAAVAEHDESLAAAASRESLTDRLAAAADAVREELERQPDDAALRRLLDASEEAVANGERAVDAARTLTADAWRRRSLAEERCADGENELVRARSLVDELGRALASDETAFALDDQAISTAEGALTEGGAALAASLPDALREGERRKWLDGKVARAEERHDIAAAELAAAEHDVARWRAEQTNVRWREARDLLTRLTARRDAEAAAVAAVVTERQTHRDALARIDAALAAWPAERAALVAGIDEATASEALAGAAVDVADRDARDRRDDRTALDRLLLGIRRRAEAEPENGALREATTRATELLAALDDDVDAATARTDAALVTLESIRTAIAARRSELAGLDARPDALACERSAVTGALAEVDARLDGARAALAAADTAVAATTEQVSELDRSYEAALARSRAPISETASAPAHRTNADLENRP